MLSKKREQIEIIQGHDTGSCFWIMPVKVVNNKSLNDKYKRFAEYEISIEEDDVFDYLAYYLFKYFDGELPANKSREFVEGFEWNLEHNFYTYDTVKSMLISIRGLLKILNDNNDEAAKQQLVAELFPEYKFADYAPINLCENIFSGRYTLPAVIRFYKEFCDFLEGMVTNCRECSLISFKGP